MRRPGLAGREALDVALHRHHPLLDQREPLFQLGAADASVLTVDIHRDRLKVLDQQRFKACERLKLETDLAQWQKLQGGSAEELLALPSISGSEEVATVRRNISTKETEIAALSGRYKSEHPKYIQASGELAVTFAQAGPGATNLLTGVAAAFMDSIPMLVLASQAATAEYGQDGHQEVRGLGQMVDQHRRLEVSAERLRSLGSVVGAGYPRSG